MSNGFMEASEDDACTDLGCTDDNLGKVGCAAPSGGGCDSGLELEDGVCIDPDADEPVITASFLNDNDLPDDLHIRDQFCKSFFCDDSFVCDASLDFKCRPCDPDKDYGEGGCGLVYANGAPAKIYVLGDDLEDDCAGSDVAASDPAVFGECS